MKEEQAKLRILNALKEISESTNDHRISELVAQVAWNLGVDLNMDFGFHELAELIGLDKEKEPSAVEHYRKIIAKNLEKIEADK